MTQQVKEIKEIKSEENKVWCNVERTVNLGNYENVKISLGEARTVGPDEDPIKVRDQIVNQCLDEADDFAKAYK
jgi:hypothetical protein